MKKRILISFFIILFISLILCSCEKKSSSSTEKLSTDIRYLASIQIEEFESKGELFFDGEKHLHLLHTDPTSPLFGMEEIFYVEKIKTNFDNLEYEKDFTPNGTALIKSIFDIIQTEKGKKEIENGVKKAKYTGEDYSFTLFSSTENPKVKTIQGTGWKSHFNINLLPKA